MNKILSLVSLLCLLANNAYTQQTGVLTGTVRSEKTGNPIAGSSVYIPELSIGSKTDTSGKFQFNQLPLRKLLVQIGANGFLQVVIEVDLTKKNTLSVTLKEAVTELGEVVVTGTTHAIEINRSPLPIVVISPKQIKESSGTTIIDAIAAQPGMAQLTTSGGISKPIIRGLGFNRVLVISDGVRQEGQQWGAEHGVEVDEFSVNRIEVLKGPASLTYGSDAMGGVINFLPENTLPQGSIQGDASLNYQTNNGLMAGSIHVAGNQKGLVWSARYSQKMAHDYSNKYDGSVYNSRFKEWSTSGMIGLNKTWGNTQLRFSYYQLTPGIPSGDRDSISGHFVKSIPVNDSILSFQLLDKKEKYSYKLALNYQRINHLKLVSNSNIYLKKGQLNILVGAQQNQRREFDNPWDSNEYGLLLLTNTLNYNFKYMLTTPQKSTFAVGVNGMYQEMKNQGAEFLIPDYQLFDVGVYSTYSKSWNKLSLSGGMRYDYRNQQIDVLWLDANEEQTDELNPSASLYFQPAALHFNGFAASIGLSYLFTKEIFAKFNVSKGFRAPSVSELSANGVHEGAQQYMLGSLLLKPENSYQTDLVFGVNAEHISVELDLFYNYIDRFIYLEKLLGAAGDSLIDGFQTFSYRSGKANLFGGEFVIDFHPHPLDWLHVENSFSVVQSMQFNQVDSMKFLPFTPAPKIMSELRANGNKLGNHLKNTYLRVRSEYFFQQNNIYSAFSTETKTPGYWLLSAGMGADICWKKGTLFSLHVSVNNLLNTGYQSHLSRLKYLGNNVANGRNGVFNMGRNISVKVIVPFVFKKAKIG